MVLSVKQIQDWLSNHQKRLHCKDSVITISKIADRAGISRQTLYAVLSGDRAEFGEVAQIRLSRVIMQISSEPSYQHTKMARIDLTGPVPTIKFRI